MLHCTPLCIIGQILCACRICPA